VDVPLSHWSYDALERLAARGVVQGLGLGLKPYTRDWIAERTLEAIEILEEGNLEFPPAVEEQMEEDLLQLSHEFAPELNRLKSSESEEERETGQPFRWKNVMFHASLWSDKNFTDIDRTGSTTLIENSSGYRLYDGLNGRWQLPAWASVGDWLAVTLNPSVRVHEETSDTDIDFEEVSLKLAHYNLEAKAGALNFWWGPGYHGEFFLTNNTHPLRAFLLRTQEGFQLPWWKLDKLGTFQAALFAARLGDKRVVQDPFVTGTRFEWSPHRRLVIGGVHTALFGGHSEEDGFTEFINALDPTQGGGENERADHLFGADVRIFLPELVRWTKLGTGLEVYGEFFGEDTKGIYIPHLVSYLGGFLVTDLFSWAGLDLRAEGVTTHDIAYEHFVYVSGYRYKNDFIGHHIGPDADDIFVRLSKIFFWNEKRFVIGTQFDRERRGVSGDALSFGDVAQTKNEFQVDLQHEVSKRMEFTVAYELEDIDNFQGSTGVDAQNHIVSLRTKFRF